MAELATATAARAPRRSRPETRLLVAPVLGVLSVALWFLAVHGSSFPTMRPLGLVTILPAAYFAGLAFVGAAMCLELVSPRPREAVLVVLIGILVLFVFGTPCAVEPTAALASSWIHAGYVQYLYTHGKALNGFNAEFSWPGAFSMMAVVIGFLGKTSAVGLLRWFPFVIELAYLAPLVAIARSCGVTRRAGWLGIALFYGTNWIYQDYFSPQAINLLFYLSAVALVLWTWRPVPTPVVHPTGLRDRLRSLPRAVSLTRLRGQEAAPRAEPRVVLWVVGALLLIMAASSMSHQLTPYAIFLALGACLLSRRLGRPELVIASLVLAVGWLSLGASNYWLGHLGDIFGSIGDFLGTLTSNVSSRVTGSASHRLIVDLRILLTAAVFGLALLGALRRACASRTLELLTIGQFLVLGAQDYGGEGLLRVALLAGPFACLLAASAIFPSRDGAIPPLLEDRVVLAGRRLRVPWPTRRVAVGIAAGVVLVGAAIATTVVRGGNDYYETFSVGEVAAGEDVYAHAAPGQTVGVVAPYVPFGQQGVGSVNVYVEVAGLTVPPSTTLGTTLVKRAPAWVLLSVAQEHWGEVLGGYPKGWEGALQSYLRAHDYVVARSWSTAVVLKRAPPKRTPPKRTPPKRAK